MSTDAIYPATVANNVDPLGQYRVTLYVPQILGTAESAWALPIQPTDTVPPVGATLWVHFSGGDITKPVYTPLDVVVQFIDAGVIKTGTINAINISGGTITGSTITGTTINGSTITSTNFATGVSGWSINKNGSAEFNNIGIRGSTTTQGLMLMYNGSPAAGNLVLSISPVAGVDAYGNAYVAGEGLYGVKGTVTAKSVIGSTAVLTGNTSRFVDAPGLLMQPAANTGDPGVIAATNDGYLIINSPSNVLNSGFPGIDSARIMMNAPGAGGTSIPVGISLIANGPGGGIGLNATSIDENGIINAYGTGLNTYIPTMTGAGTATFSTRTGWWQRVGPMIFFNATFITSAIGTGTATIAITAPTAIDRTVQQVVTGHIAGTAGVNGTVAGIALTTGTSTTIDRIRTSTGANITGADLANGASAGAAVNIQGWYREA
jgi:hypothetical protein